VAQYGSSDAGASLGDILGAALKEKAGSKAVAEPKAEKADKAEKAEAKPKKAKAKKDEAEEAEEA